jgi:WD40 repeat protein
MRPGPLAALALTLSACSGDPRPIARPPAPPPVTIPAANTLPIAPQPLRVELFGAHREAAAAIALSPDGDTLAVAMGASIELWNATTGKVVATRALAAPTKTLRFADGGQILVTDAGALRVDTGAAVTAPPSPAAKAPVIAPSGDGVRWSELAPDRRKRLEKWAKRQGAVVTVTPDGVTLARRPGPAGGDPDFRVSADGLIVSNSDSRFLRLDTGTEWTAAAWTTGFAGMGGETGGEIQGVYGPDPERMVLLSISRRGAVYEFSEARLVDTRSGKTIDSLTETCQPNVVLWSPRGKYVMRLSCTGLVFPTLLSVVEARTGHLVATIESSGEVELSDDERRLAVLDGQGNASLWDLPAGARSLFVPGTGRPPSLDLWWSRDGRSLFDLRAGGIDIWDLGTGRLAGKIPVPGANPRIVQWDRDEKNILVATGDGFAVIDVAARRLRARFAHGWMRPDGDAMAIAEAGAVTIVPIEGTAPRLRLKLPRAYARELPTIAWSKDGASIAAGFEHGAILLLDAATGAVRAKLADDAPDTDVRELVFQPGGGLLAAIQAVGGSPRVLLIDLDHDARATIVAACPDASPAHLGFSRDGRRILVNCRSHEDSSKTWIAVVDAATRSPVASLPLPRFLTNADTLLDVSAAGLDTATDRPLWLWPKVLPRGSSSAITPSPDGAFAALSEGGALRIVRRVDDQTATLLAYTFGRDEIAAVTTEEGQFDADDASRSLVRAARGSVTADPADLAAHARPGLLAEFLKSHP